MDQVSPVPPSGTPPPKKIGLLMAFPKNLGASCRNPYGPNPPRQFLIGFKCPWGPGAKAQTRSLSNHRQEIMLGGEKHLHEFAFVDFEKKIAQRLHQTLLTI